MTYSSLDPATARYSGRLVLCAHCEGLIERTNDVRMRDYLAGTLSWQDGKAPAVVERIDEQIELAAAA